MGKEGYLIPCIGVYQSKASIMRPVANITELGDATDCSNASSGKRAQSQSTI